jgi:hypothetical protein
MSNGRRLLGPAALVATAGGLATVALHDLHWIEGGILAYAGVVAAAGVGLARRSMAAQVLSRGTAWTVLAPSALVTAFTMVNGHFDWAAAALALGSGSALLLAHPMVRTAEAQAEFAPSSFRRWLLAGATASVGAGVVTGLFALDGLRWHAGTAIALLALALSLVASALGVVKMRAWGILLGALTSVVTFVAAGVMHDAAGLALALASIPGFMLLLPVLVAQRERKRTESQSFTRVASHVAMTSDAPSRVRIATDSPRSFDDEFDAQDDDRMRAPAPVARAQA